MSGLAAKNWNLQSGCKGVWHCSSLQESSQKLPGDFTYRHAVMSFSSAARLESCCSNPKRSETEKQFTLLKIRHMGSWVLTTRVLSFFEVCRTYLWCNYCQPEPRLCQSIFRNSLHWVKAPTCTGRPKMKVVLGGVKHVQLEHAKVFIECFDAFFGQINFKLHINDKYFRQKPGK